MERGRTAFDHWMHRHYFTFRDLRDRNISVQCNLCLPKINILSTARDSTSNLKKHLECHSPCQMRKRQHTEMSEPEPLFLPPKRLKSVVWEYFGYLKDPGGTILVDGYPVCRMCRKKVSARAGNTSNMMHHLRDHHPKEFAKLNRKHAVPSKIQEIHSSYNIESKVQATVTDNGNNFVKAFKEFSSEDDQELEDSRFEDLGSILCDGEMGGDFFLSYFLPPHQRCAAQTLNLIASKDLADAVSKAPSGKLHSSAMAKCAAIWHKTHSSSEAAEAMESIAKMTITGPCLNKWSSEYCAVNKLMSLTDSQLNELTEALGVSGFTPDETAYLTEYTDVFKPVAFALDLLQGEEKCFLGIVIPTLLTLKRKLEEKAANTRLFSQVIEDTVKAIDSGFKQVFDSSDARLATATMPQFRLWWLPEEEREALRAQLITEVVQVDQTCTEETETNGGSVHEDDFFSYGPGSSGNKSGVKKVFIKFNTTLPSSSPVQQLFSNGANAVIPKGNHLSDEHFERVLLLRYNSKITTALE
ncbi:zinc finger BED domain-containing protein 4-like [Pimephales promelas]|nr:zinc finger BED domain-containing protein 4-like [Pimephales promelas]